MPLSVHLPQGQPIAGVRLATLSVGIKSKGKPDLVMVALPEAASVAGVFTQNHFAAAPVQLCRRHLSESAGRLRALLINSGNANAGTGEEGLSNAQRCCEIVARALDCQSQEVMPFSTGVIGVQLPMTLMSSGIIAASQSLGESSQHWLQAAQGIMTTDTQVKFTGRTLELEGGRRISLSGMAKGAGMIEPHMATMLGYLFTDATVAPQALDAALREAVADTFNAISIDSDTSTNDCVVLTASGQGAELVPGARDWEAFVSTLTALCLDLATAIVRDGEGVSKFIRVRVDGGLDRDECRRVAYAIVNSPLVKTAMSASDANVGRLLMAIGKADVSELDSRRVRVFIGDVAVFEHGAPASGYTEAAGAAAVAGEEIDIRVELGRGTASATVFGSDLTHDYVSINADYRS